MQFCMKKNDLIFDSDKYLHLKVLILALLNVDCGSFQMCDFLLDN